MSIEPTNLTSEDLAAYLDGELTREETQKIESRLVNDAAMRSELGQLQKAWDLLDALPRAKVDENFSTTTMSLAVAELRSVTTKKVKWVNSLRLAGIFGGLTVAALLGYFAIQQIVYAPVRDIERNMHLLTNFDTYNHLSENFLGDKNLEFLRLLQSSGLFVAPESSPPASQGEVTTLAALTSDAHDEVLRNYQTLQNQNRDPAKTASIRALAEQIGADPSRLELLRTYDRYYHWLQGLPVAEIREIEGAQEPAHRLELVRTRIQRQNRNRFDAILKSENLRVLLTKQDYEVYMNWLGEFIAAHQNEFVKVIADDETLRRRLDKVTDERQRHFYLYGCYLQKVGEGNALVPSQTDFSNLTQRLSDDARKQFSAMELDEQQRRQLLKALRDAWWRAIYSPPASEEDLNHVLKSLSQDERERLAHLKKSDLRRALIERYEKLREQKNRERKPSGRKPGDQSKESLRKALDEESSPISLVSDARLQRIA